MMIGFNYTSYNAYGSQIGPYMWGVSDADWAKYYDLEARGQVSAIPLSPTFSFLDRNLKNLKGMGIAVVRWNLLGHGNNYGPSPTRASPSDSYSFSPPPRVDARFARDFREILERFKRAQLQIIPSLIDFKFTGDLLYTPGPMPGLGAAARADIIRDPVKRKLFLDTMLGTLLEVSKDYPQQIYAWEVANEPFWMSFEYGLNSVPSTKKRRPEVNVAQVQAFLKDATARIEAAGFKSTVGHRFFTDMTTFKAAGTRPQFHYYAKNSGNVSHIEMGVTSLVGLPSDPPKIKGSHLFDLDPIAKQRPFLGEFSSEIDFELAEPWYTDFVLGGSTSDRLQLLESEGCELAMLWPDLPDSAVSDTIKLASSTRQAIVDFTKGTLPNESLNELVPRGQQSLVQGGAS